MIRSFIFEEVSAAHSERHHLSELNIDFIKKFEIDMGPPAADRALLEKENDDGMCAAHRRVARRLNFAPMDDRRRHFLGKAAESKEYCEWVVKALIRLKF